MRRQRLASAFAVLITACGEHIDYGSTEQASTYSCTGTMVQGVDVSSYQGSVDWTQVAGGGYQFAVAKATEGLTIQDSEFSTYWPAIKSAGILRSAYHFFHPMDDGTSQADGFLCTVLGEALGCTLPATFTWPGDFPPALDWETTDNGVSGSTAIQQAQAFVTEVKARTGVTTIIYGSPGFLAGIGSLSQFSSSLYWEADYTGSISSCPETQSPWTAWTFWQWSDTGTVPGIGSGMDVDVFNGTLTQLQALGGGTSTPTALPSAQVSGNDSVTLVDWPDKHVGLFAKTPAGAAQYTATSGTGDAWSTPTTLDTGAECGSAAGFWGAHWTYPELFSPLSSGTGHLSWTSSGGWNSYATFTGGVQYTHLSTAVGLDGRVEVFGLGSDSAIWTNSWNTTTSAWNGWTSLGGTFVTGVGPVTWGDGTVEIFATDASGTVSHMWSDSTGAANWSSWNKMTGPAIASRPVPVRWSDGMDGHGEVFARGQDGQLYHSDFSYTSGWPGFTVVSAGSQIVGEVSAIMNPGGSGATQGPEVFSRDVSGTVVHLAWNGSAYGTFAPLGNQAAVSDPFGWIRGDGAAEVFALDEAGALVHAYHNPASGWTAWSSIGGDFDPCVPALNSGQPDAGTPAPDAGPQQTDAGSEKADAGIEKTDAGVEKPDAGSEKPDAGTRDRDGGASPSVDGGSPVAQTGGCGCGSTGDSALALVMLVAAMARRRRAR